MTAQVFTIANQLTLLRMLLIPAFVILTLYGEFGWALAVFIIAVIAAAIVSEPIASPERKSFVLFPDMIGPWP